jgi:outer membrane beta-barrel protein
MLAPARYALRWPNLVSVAVRSIGLGVALWAFASLLPSQPRGTDAPNSPVSWAIGPSSAHAQCIDEAIQDELNARRRYRGVRERLFQKAGRFELTLLGGIYAADLLSASYLVSGALTYHVTEELGLEASFGYSRADSELVRIIEQDRGISLIRIDAPVYLYQAHLLWTLAYGKLRWFGAEIGRFDIRLAIGGGITDNQTSRGLTGSAGLGASFFIGEWFAIRVDVRDQILEQSILGESRIVNNLTATLGLSVFIPFEN